MKRKNFDTEDEYLEFRRKANLRNKKYYSKPEVKTQRAIYKKEHDKLPHVKEAAKKMRQTTHYKTRYKKWVKENREHLKEYRNKPENKIKKAISDKKFRKGYYKRPEVQKKLKKYRKKVWEEQRGEIIKKRNKYYTTPEGKAVQQRYVHKRLTLMRGGENTLTNSELLFIKKRDKECVYCSGKKPLEIDHIVPLSKGGSTSKNNIVMACQRCNRTKNAKDVFKWCNAQGIEVPTIIIKLIALQKIKV